MSLSIKPMPDMKSIKRDVLRVQSAREKLDELGGPSPLLDELASGGLMVNIAKSRGVSIAQINAYLRATCDPDDVEAATASSIRSRMELLDIDADQIDDAKQRVAAKMDIVKWQADKETLAYKNKSSDVSHGGVTINIDWSRFDSPPEVIVDADI